MYLSYFSRWKFNTLGRNSRWDTSKFWY